MTWRGLYICLLRLHPLPFQRRFADEMLWIFDQVAYSQCVAPLLVDAAKSLFRQWILRPREASNQTRQLIERGPAFRGLERNPLRAGALLNGALISVLAFVGVFYCSTHGGGHWEGMEQFFYSLEARSLNPWEKGEAFGSRSRMPPDDVAHFDALER